MVGGIANLTLLVNSVNASVDNPMFTHAVTRLHGCGLVGLNLEGNDLGGTFTPEVGEVWGALTRLRHFNLANNWIHGEIPDMRHARSLRTFELATNWINGTIPEWLGDLDKLERLNLGGNAGENIGFPDELGIRGALPASLAKLRRLRELNMEANSLSGEIPELCPGDEDGNWSSQLVMLNLRQNRLEGNRTAERLLHCTAITSLDISYNRLSGPLPVNSAWENLGRLQAAGNHFSSALPSEMFLLPYLASIDVSANKLTGSIPLNITLLTYLNNIWLSANLLSGVIPAEVFYLPQLSRAYLDSNQVRVLVPAVLATTLQQFSGSLPEAVGYAYGLTELVVNRNPKLRGDLPDELGMLSFLWRVDARATALSCARTVTEEDTDDLVFDRNMPQCPADNRLPCFLEFTDVYQQPPRSPSGVNASYTGMTCRMVRRRTIDSAWEQCDRVGVRLAQPSEDDATGQDQTLMQSWDIDPFYFQYSACKCLEGYSAVWEANSTRLVCESTSQTAWWVKLLAALAGAVVLVLLAAIVVAQIRRTRYQPRWLRHQAVVRKRAAGIPRRGQVSVVVTDIEGFSDLFRARPQLMGQALQLHNAVLRRCCWAQGGHIVEQEGDSFTIAFYDAADAVCFCLQAQMALLRVAWPKNLMAVQQHHTPTKEHSDRRKANGGDRGLVGDGAGGGCTVSHSATKSGSFDAGRPDPMGGQQDATLGSHTPFDSRCARGTSDDEGAKLKDCPTLRVVGHPVSGRNEDGETAEDLVDRSNSAGLMSSFSSGFSSTSTTATRTSALREEEAARYALFYGLRVRMGIATGLLPVVDKDAGGDSLHGSTRSLRDGSDGVDIRNAAVFDLAKVVSDAGNGGQILMEAVTFALVKDRMHEFGAVDHNGINETLLAQQQRAMLSCCGGGSRDRYHGDSDDDGDHANEVLRKGGTPLKAASRRRHGAVVLDMGEYIVGGLDAAAACLGKAAADHPAKDSKAHSEQHHSRDPAKKHDAVIGAVQAAVAALSHPSRLRLYSIMSRDLASRALVWGNALALNMQHPGMIVQTDAAYFTAAGALEADLGGTGASRHGRLPVPTHLQPLVTAHLAQQHGLGGTAPVGRMGSRLASLLHRQMSSAAGEDVSDLTTQASGLSVLAPFKKLKRTEPLASSNSSSSLDFKLQRAVLDVEHGKPGSVPAATLWSHGKSSVLPPVTMVFASVEGARQLARRHRVLACATHRILSETLRAILRDQDSPATGYLCREQEGDLKYMIVFSSPRSAMEWCLVVQQALLHAPWPEELLEQPGFETMYSDVVAAPSVRQLLFRGPRLKMGVCEGCPRTISPDHLGRADFQGASVNQAARYMAAAAHGGMIACELSLAQRVLQEWAMQQGDGRGDGTPDTPVVVQHLGVYQFKGSGVQEMASFTTQTLAARPFPDEPPCSGKGQRLKAQQGLVVGMAPLGRPI